MKNNSNIITEILRIQELMGKKTINEQWTAIAKTIPKLGDEFTDLLNKYADDILRLTNVTTDDEALKILAKLANSERKFADKILPEIVKNIPDDVSKEIGKIIEVFQDQLNKGVDRTAVNKLVQKRIDAIKTPFKGLKELLKKQVNDALDGHVIKPPKDINVNVQNLNDLEYIKKTFAEWDRLAPGVLSTTDKLALNDLFFRGLRAKLRYVSKNILNNSEKIRKNSIENIVSLLKKQSNSLDAGKSNVMVDKVISVELEALRKDEDFAINEYLRVLEQELGKKIGTGKAYRMIESIKSKNPLSEDAQSFWRYLMDDYWVGNILPTIGKESTKKYQVLANFVQRTFMSLTIGTPIKINEIFKYFLKRYGTVKGVAVWYAFMWAAHRTIWPAFLSLLSTIYVGWPKMFGGPDEEFKDYGGFIRTYGHFLKERFYDQFTNFVQEFDKEGRKIGIPERELDIIKSINAFEWLWDSFENGLDWWVKGESNQVLSKIVDKGAQEYEEKYETVTGKVDSMKNKIQDLDFLHFQNNLESFQDFGNQAGYKPEEQMEFQYDPINKVGITNDGRKYIWIELPDKPGKGFGTFEPQK